MLSCNMANFLYEAVPSARFRDWLIRAHMDGCGRCQAGLVSRLQARTLLVGPEEAGKPGELWRKIQPQADRGGGMAAGAPVRAGFRWEWAAGAATAVLVSLVSLWLVRGLQPGGGGLGVVRPADRFEINYIHVGGSQAQAYIYQPQGSDTILVWAARNP